MTVDPIPTAEEFAAIDDDPTFDRLPVDEPNGCFGWVIAAFSGLIIVAAYALLARH